MKTGDGIIREYRIVNGRQVLVRSMCLGGGVTVGGRGIDISRFLTEMPRRDIGLKPRSEWGKKATSPKVRKAAEVKSPEVAAKVVEAKPVAEMPSELKPEERKALETIEAAEIEKAIKEAEAATAAARAAVKFEEPPNDLFDAMEYAGVVKPEAGAGGETRAALPELPRPAEDGRKKHKRRRRRR